MLHVPLQTLSIAIRIQIFSISAYSMPYIYTHSHTLANKYYCNWKYFQMSYGFYTCKPRHPLKASVLSDILLILCSMCYMMVDPGAGIKLTFAWELIIPILVLWRNIVRWMFRGRKFEKIFSCFTGLWPLTIPFKFCYWSWLPKIQI